MNIDEILSEREKSYGRYSDNARVCQRIKSAFRAGKNWDGLEDFKKESLEMLAVKIARLLNGDSSHMDTIHDCIGYLELMLREINHVKIPTHHPTGE